MGNRRVGDAGTIVTDDDNQRLFGGVRGQVHLASTSFVGVIKQVIEHALDLQRVEVGGCDLIIFNQRYRPPFRSPALPHPVNHPTKERLEHNRFNAERRQSFAGVLDDGVGQRCGALD